MAPPAALLFGLLPFPAEIGPILWSLSPLVLISLGYSLPMYAHPSRYGPERVSEYVRAHTTSDDSVWSDPSARLLLEAGDMNSAVNRAYYAMFDAERAALGSVDAKLLKTKKHAAVIRRNGIAIVSRYPGLTA